MPIPFTCPHCELKTLVDDKFAGKSGPCAGCGMMVVVPLTSPEDPRTGASGAFSTWTKIVGIIVGVLALVLFSVGLVAMIAVPTVTAARNAAHVERCSQNLTRIASAFNAFHDEHGHYPPAYSVDENGKPLHSWRVLILPYLGNEELAIYNRLDLNKPWNAPENVFASFGAPTVYQCPSDPDTGSGMTSYLVVTGPGTMFDGSKTITRQQLAKGDGASQTIMVVESSQSSIPWNQPTDIGPAQLQLGINPGATPSCCSHHQPSGIHIAYADGTVQFIPDYVPVPDLVALTTVAGGEIVLPFD